MVTEMLHALYEIGINKIAELCNKIFDSEYIPASRNKNPVDKLVKSQGIEIRRGTKQGCVISPYHFNLFTEHIFKPIESENEEVSVGGRKISILLQTTQRFQ